MGNIEIILICLGGLIVGAGIGATVSSRLFGDRRREKKAEKRLAETEQELKSYRHEVAHHFEHTALLVENLTESYRDLHNHLADGAQGLMDLPHAPAPIGALSESNDETRIQPAIAEDISAPRDYAPKSYPYEPGMLDESFGLDRQAVEEHADTPIKQPAAAT
ncbi:MAG: YhcB family protein [Pseudomonadales bacterium]